MTDPTTRAEEGEHPTNDTLERIGAFGRSCKIGKHQATNWVHLRATVDALDAAGQHEAADTLIWQVWHRVNSRARYQEFYNLGTSAERAAESRAASAEAEVEKLTRERDEALCLAEGPSSLKEMASHLVGCSLELYNAEASASALRDRVAVLESALAPFAEEADSLEAGDCGHLWESPQAMNLTTDHLRAARAALKESTDV